MQLISEYLEFLEVEKGLSENTTTAYRTDLISFFDFCNIVYFIRFLWET